MPGSKMLAAEFQSTLPCEGRHKTIINTRICDSFNPRPRVRGDNHPAMHTVDIVSFNPRPRVRGDICMLAALFTMGAKLGWSVVSACY